MQQKSLWLVYAILVTVFWGVWGAVVDVPRDNHFPETLNYVVWSLTMVPPAIVALWIAKWKLDYDFRSVLLGLVVGFLGAGGQLIVLKALSLAPAYLVFSVVALSPVVTILLALAISRERAAWFGWVGIVLALVAGVMLYYNPEKKANSESLWVILALIVLVAWGIQGFIFSYANRTMRAESIFFYMALTGVLLAPVAIAMTDFSQTINWGLKGPYLAAIIQPLNSVGALLIVYAFRYGKAIIVAPMTNAGAPAITIAISLALASSNPTAIQIAGMVAAVVAALLMAIEEEQEAEAEEPATEAP